MSRAQRDNDEMERLMSRVEKTDSCWLWTGAKHPYGYGVLRSRRTKCGKVLAHRLSYELHRGPIEPGLFVLHSCDVFACVNPDHLHVGTNADNIAEAVERRRMASGDRNGSRTHPERRCFGSRNGMAKLTRSDVAEIKRLRFEERLKLKEIARRFGVTFQAVSKITTGVVWRDVHVGGA